MTALEARNKIRQALWSGRVTTAELAFRQTEALKTAPACKTMAEAHQVWDRVDIQVAEAIR